MKSTYYDRKGLLVAYMVGCVIIALPLVLLNIITVEQLIPIIAVFVLVLTLVNPRWGLVAMIASLAVIEVLPDIPLVSSFSALLGAITLGSFLVHVFIFRTLPLPPKLTGVFFAGLIFIVWIFVSHPAAALILGDRVWIWTFVQLWLVAWLARNLIDDEPTMKLLAVFFILANLISVLIVFQEGQIGDNIYQSRRGYGLGQGSNGTARYLILALLFTYYLYMTSVRKKTLQSLLYLASALILTLGVIYTVSRTGLILILLAVGLILISPSTQSRGRKLGFLLLGFVGISVFVPTNAFNLIETILPSIVEGTDTAGLRYSLWTAGMKMFSDSPFTGVGIGQFQYLLPKYGMGIVPTAFINLTAHSTYVQLLSETGLIGLLLFVIMVFLALKNLYVRMHYKDYTQALTAWMWFSLIVIILIGAFTKTDLAEKLLWVGLGMGYANIPQGRSVAAF